MINDRAKKITVEFHLPAEQIGNAELKALNRYFRRKLRWEHPEGIFDKAGRWFARGDDRIALDAAPFCPRSPSRSFPYSQMQACRSLSHCCRLDSALEINTKRYLIICRYLRRVLPTEKFLEVLATRSTNLSFDDSENLRQTYNEVRARAKGDRSFIWVKLLLLCLGHELLSQPICRASD